MIKVIQEKDESRKDYLIRVAIAMLKHNAYSMDSIHYDEAVCDAFCLAEDLSIEFGFK